MSKSDTPALPQEGGSYVVDRSGKPVLKERTVESFDPEHPENKPAETPVETPVKEA